jgi:coproporphyrinogen III oxidase-like Fe-S oxidoreductase
MSAAGAGDDPRSARAEELARRLALVQDVLERSPDPLEEPFGVRYAPLDGEEYVRAWSEHAARVAAGAAPVGAVLYVHVPFCARVCSYCLLSASKTPGNGPMDAYVRALRAEIGRMEPAVRGLRFSSLHVGGGTPSLLREEQLDGLLGDLASFARADGFQIGVEAHPSTASPAKLRVLQRHGVHRVSLGVESFTPEVLRAVQRGDQTDERVAAAVDAARSCGLGVNLDLLAGLPGETEATFAESIRRALALEPDSMSVNRFLAENSALEGAEPGALEEETRRADRMLLDADRIVREVAPPRWPAEPLAAAGYGTQYVWDRSDRARAYFQQDMIGPASTLALGHGGMGHVVGRFHSIAAGAFTDYVTSIERGEPPAMLASPVTARFERAFFLADRMCRDSVAPRDFAAVFGQDPRLLFGDELGFLVARGLLRVQDGRLRKAPGRAFQVTHLLAFLALDGDALARSAARLPAGDTPRGGPRAQYESIAAELPPSLLWCRMAIRASRSRGLVRRAP